jgi:hypothetical protein
MTIERRVVIELFSIIHAEGMWTMLSPDTQSFGEQLYLEETGASLSAPPGGMKYSVEQHMELVDRILPRHHKATDFWKIVTQITWFVLAIEKNPMLAMEIRESDDPLSILEALETRSQR